MIELILQLLKEVNGETENIRIAKGKNKLPETFIGVFKKFKKEKQWR